MKSFRQLGNCPELRKKCGKHEKTYDGTQEVVGTFQQVYVSAEQLREISDKLVKGIGYFHI